MLLLGKYRNVFCSFYILQTAVIKYDKGRQTPFLIVCQIIYRVYLPTNHKSNVSCVTPSTDVPTNSAIHYWLSEFVGSRG